jgi:hypothetical protein
VAFSTRTRVAAVVVVGALLVLSGGPGRFWRRAAPGEAGAARARRLARPVPYRIQIDLDPARAGWGVQHTAAIRTALFTLGVSTRNEIASEAELLAAPHLVIRLGQGRGETVRIEGRVARQPLGTLTAETLRRCGDRVDGSPPMVQGAALGASIAVFVECFHQFADSSARAR